MDGEIHVEYDAVLLASGSTEVIRDQLAKQIEHKSNVYSWKNFSDYEKLKTGL